jgi:hypothetical protein
MPTHFPSAPLRLVARARSPSQTPRVVRLGDAGYGPATPSYPLPLQMELDYVTSERLNLILTLTEITARGSRTSTQGLSWATTLGRWATIVVELEQGKVCDLVAIRRRC